MIVLLLHPIPVSNPIYWQTGTTITLLIRHGYAQRCKTVSATVLHENATYADAWSTTLLACSYRRALQLISQFQLSAILQTLEQGEILLHTFGNVPSIPHSTKIREFE